MNTITAAALKKLTRPSAITNGFLCAPEAWGDVDKELSYGDPIYVTAPPATTYTANHVGQAASILVTFKVGTVIGTKFWICDFDAPSTPDQQNGYRVEFTAADTVKLYKITAGVDAELDSETLSASLSTSTYHTLIFAVDRGGVYADLDGSAILTSTDSTHRLTTWHVQVTAAGNTYFRAFHILSNGSYFESGLEPTAWNTSTDITVGADTLVIPEDWDGWAAGLNVPSSGYDLYFDVRPAADTAAVSTVTFTTGGGALNDMSAAGAPLVTVDTSYVVQIDGAGVPDTYKWSNDAGASWEATTVNLASGWVYLELGVFIKFAATTGHTVGDKWAWTAYADHSYINVELEPPKGSGGIGVRVACYETGTPKYFAVSPQDPDQGAQLSATDFPLRWQIIAAGGGTTMYLDDDAGNHELTIAEGAGAVRRTDWFLHLTAGAGGATLYRVWAEENSLGGTAKKALYSTDIGLSQGGYSASGASSGAMDPNQHLLPSDGWTY